MGSLNGKLKKAKRKWGLISSAAVQSGLEITLVLNYANWQSFCTLVIAFYKIQGLWKRSNYSGGGEVTLVGHVVIACLLNKCVSLYGKEEYKFQLKIKIMPVEQPFGFEVSLKRTARTTCKHCQAWNKEKPSCPSPARGPGWGLLLHRWQP